MTNFAGIERILSCKMNYLAKNTGYHIVLSTYEQQNTPLPFPLELNIHYEAMNVVMPKREQLNLFDWILKYVMMRKKFRKCYSQLLKFIAPKVVVCTSYSFQVMDIILEEAYKNKINVIIESHTTGETVTFAYKYSYDPKLQSIFRRLDKYIMRRLKYANRIVTLTKQDALYWKEYSDRIEIIPNMLTIQPMLVNSYTSKRVISAGRYMPEKGFDRLIEAWSILQKLNHSLVDWQLYIYGNGDRKKYKSLVTKLGLDDSVHLEPATKNITEKFSNSSLYVMSSRYEGFGLVLSEAMSCGLPCISFDCPYGPRDVIRNGDDGILIEDGNITALAKAMEYMMSDEKLREKMGRKAIENISRYSRDNIMPKWISLFNSL